MLISPVLCLPRYFQARDSPRFSTLFGAFRRAASHYRWWKMRMNIERGFSGIVDQSSASPGAAESGGVRANNYQREPESLWTVSRVIRMKSTLRSSGGVRAVEHCRLASRNPWIARSARDHCQSQHSSACDTHRGYLFHFLSCICASPMTFPCESRPVPLEFHRLYICAPKSGAKWDGTSNSVDGVIWTKWNKMG